MLFDGFKIKDFFKLFFISAESIAKNKDLKKDKTQTQNNTQTKQELSEQAKKELKTYREQRQSFTKNKGNNMRH
jgi:hypothetical protein